MATAKQSAANIMKLITEIGKQGAAYQALINDAIKACIAHGREHHDVTLMMRLVNTISETCGIVVVNEIKAYFERYSPVQFEYAADDKAKRNPINATEKKDENGELVKPYATDEQVTEKPIQAEKSVAKRTKDNIEPFSYAMLRQRIGAFQSQLSKSGDSEGRGILGPDGKTYRKGQPGYDGLYAKYEQTVRRLNAGLDLMFVPLSELKEPEKLSDLPATKTELIANGARKAENNHAAMN